MLWTLILENFQTNDTHCILTQVSHCQCAQLWPQHFSPPANTLVYRQQWGSPGRHFHTDTEYTVSFCCALFLPILYILQQVEEQCVLITFWKEPLLGSEHLDRVISVIQSLPPSFPSFLSPLLTLYLSFFFNLNCSRLLPSPLSILRSVCVCPTAAWGNCFKFKGKAAQGKRSDIYSYGLKVQRSFLWSSSPESDSQWSHDSGQNRQESCFHDNVFVQHE